MTWLSVIEADLKNFGDVRQPIEWRRRTRRMARVIRELAEQITSLTDETVREFAASNRGREVHRSWVNNMQAQGRRVDFDKLNWDDLPARDVRLDQCIAYDVIRDFMVWFQGHNNPSPDAKELLTKIKE